MDLTGDGHETILVRYRERAGQTWRDLLVAYRPGAEGLQRSFAVEIGKGEGDKKLESRVSYAKRKKATDIVVEALPPVGYTEATYRESPAEDAVPILLPWKEKRARFQFRGDQYVRSE
jgi:hypothetical protein